MKPETNCGDDSEVQEDFKPLEERAISHEFDKGGPLIPADVVSASFITPPVYEFSAWSELIPVLSGLFSIVKPRRFVELGVHNGMSFFAACKAADTLDLGTECVAIDSWMGDAHAGLHDTTVFEGFKRNLKNLFPKQKYIRSLFETAVECFENGSIDLLHIDGLHTYDAVKGDFETWLPKMSDCGVIIFHDVNVYRKDFGVWRYWEELSKEYPSFSFMHSHGLGILYVGTQETPIKTILEQLAKQPEIGKIMQASAHGIGETLIENARLTAELEHVSSKAAAELEHVSSKLSQILNDKWWKRTRALRKISNFVRKMRGKPKKSWPSL